MARPTRARATAKPQGRRGVFITLEGGEGAGKSTQIKRLASKIQVLGKDVAVTREPGGAPGAEAIRTLLVWAGDDPAREGLRDTPKRVAKAYEELFKGYAQDAGQVLSTIFEEVEGYDDMVLVKDIPFASHCEHHMVPFVGKAHVAYFPSEGVVGL